MGKNLKGKELGKGIRQHKNGKYEARFLSKSGTKNHAMIRNLALVIRFSHILIRFALTRERILDRIGWVGKEALHVLF